MADKNNSLISSGERSKFEAWAESQDLSLASGRAGGYMFADTTAAWSAWQTVLARVVAVRDQASPEWVQKGLDLAKTLGAHPNGSALHSKAWVDMRDHLASAPDAISALKDTPAASRTGDASVGLSPQLGWAPGRTDVGLTPADHVDPTRAALDAAQSVPAVAVTDSTSAYYLTSTAVARILTLLQLIKDSRFEWGGWPGTENACEEAGSLLRYSRHTRLDEVIQSAPMASAAAQSFVNPASLAAVEDLTDAARDVLAERHRQVFSEDYTHDHDDEHVNDEIAALACFYAMPPGARDWDASSTGYGATLGDAILPPDWLTSTGDRRRELIKAGALIIAELERLDRAAIAASKEDGNG